MIGIWVPLKATDSIEIETFENKIKPTFLKYVDCENIEEYKEKNKNIEAIFYNRKELAELMKQENTIEKKWKSRILIQNTPRGNILMFYDAYKGGFSYYSDHSIVPLRILNTVAMKYVMNYFCLDFFVDQLAFKNNTSPLIELLNEEDNEDNKKMRKIFTQLAENTNMNTNQLPFLKSKSILSDRVSTPTIKKFEKRINKFIYLGKFNNYSIIQKEKKNNILSSKTDNVIFKNVNYDEYKKSKNKTN